MIEMKMGRSLELEDCDDWMFDQRKKNFDVVF